MTTTAQIPVEVTHERPAATRLASIDIFRGLTIAVMIFVNELAGVRGLPWWNYHMKANVDAMTYVDMVFPFFCSSWGSPCRWRFARGSSAIHRCLRCGCMLRCAPPA